MSDLAKLRAEAFAKASRATSGAVLALRSGGAELSTADADALLAKAVARERVELELTVLAFEQRAGEHNRNHVRFRDGAMLALGRSGRGVPFLRDHDQGSVEARGGTVIESKTIKVDDGHYRIEQVVRLTEPAAVERALRGLMTGVSIGWHPTGPVDCSLCGRAVLERGWCGHWPGDAVKLDNGARVVTAEWVYTAAELLETSEVSVPAVPRAGIEGVRAALSVLSSGECSPTTEKQNMEKLQSALAGKLGLPLSSTDDDIAAAVDLRLAKLSALEAQAAEFHRLQAKAAAEAEAMRAQLAAQELEDFTALGRREGKTMPDSPMEAALRNYFQADKDGARGLLASMPRITPVGEPRQSAAPAPVVDAAPKLSSAAERIKNYNPIASLDGVRRALLSMGKTTAEADAIISRQLAAKEG